MREPVNFRLSTQTLEMLSSLALASGIPKTRVLERAIDEYAKRHRAPPKRAKAKPAKKLAHPALAYIGMWKDVDVDKMLKTIYSTRSKGRRLPK